MSVIHPDPTPHRVHTVHRLGAVAVGVFLLLFAAVSLLQPVGFLPHTEVIVMGLATSGALAIVSLLIGAVLVMAAVRGGPTASSVSVVVGAAFLLSGLGNALVLDTGLNMLGFRLSNVIFSLAVGFVLLVLGAYGRFTGSLPADSPYATSDTPTSSAVRDVPAPVDGRLAASLAAAERAVADRVATPGQAAGVAAAGRHHTHADRSRAFSGAAGHPAGSCLRS